MSYLENLFSFSEQENILFSYSVEVFGQFKKK